MRTLYIVMSLCFVQKEETILCITFQASLYIFCPTFLEETIVQWQQMVSSWKHKQRKKSVATQYNATSMLFYIVSFLEKNSLYIFPCMNGNKIGIKISMNFIHDSMLHDGTGCSFPFPAIPKHYTDPLFTKKISFYFGGRKKHKKLDKTNKMLIRFHLKRRRPNQYNNLSHCRCRCHENQTKRPRVKI